MSPLPPITPAPVPPPRLLSSAYLQKVENAGPFCPPPLGKPNHYQCPLPPPLPLPPLPPPAPFKLSFNVNFGFDDPAPPLPGWDVNPGAAALPAESEDPDDMDDTPLVLLPEGFLGGFSNGRVKDGVLAVVELGLEFAFELEVELSR